MAPMIVISWGWIPPPPPIRHLGTGFSISNWKPWWVKKTTKFSARIQVKAVEAHPEEGIYTSPNVLGKFTECDGIPLRRFVADLNLALEVSIPRPLKSCNLVN